MNILFLVSRYYYEQKMSRCRFHQMAAVGRCEGVHVAVWGRGFPGYRDEAPLQENIQRQFGTGVFDLIHVYKPDDHKAVAACPVPKSIDYNEAWNRKATIKEVVQNDIRFVVFHHENDFVALKTTPRLSRGGAPVAGEDCPCAPDGIFRRQILPAAHALCGAHMHRSATGRGPLAPGLSYHGCGPDAAAIR